MLSGVEDETSMLEEASEDGNGTVVSEVSSEIVSDVDTDDDGAYGMPEYVLEEVSDED